MSNLHPIFEQALAPYVNPLRFASTYCSQCGGEFGPGSHGFSRCADHKNESWHTANDARALRQQINRPQTAEGFFV